MFFIRVSRHSREYIYNLCRRNVKYRDSFDKIFRINLKMNFYFSTLRDTLQFAGYV